MKDWNAYGHAGNAVAIIESKDMLRRWATLSFGRSDPHQQTQERVKLGIVPSVNAALEVTSHAEAVTIPTDCLEALANLFGARDDTLARRVKELEDDRARLQELVQTLSKAIAITRS